jgi:UDP-N-acetylmuramyl tripeptide synthase
LVIAQEQVQTDLCTVVVKDIKKATAQIAKAFYGNPQEDLRIVGVVGTNGKTTICHVLANLLTEGGFEVGVTGTIGTRYKGKSYPSSLTTPSCLNLYKLIFDMVQNGVEILLMEVSAHAIEQRRCEDYPKITLLTIS